MFVGEKKTRINILTMNKVYFIERSKTITFKYETLVY